MSNNFSRQCRALRIGTLAVIAMFLLLIGFGFVGSPMPIRLDDAALEPWQWWSLRLTFMLPALGYLAALWFAQRALGDLAAGSTFQVPVSRAMRQIGTCVLAGALLEVFAITNLARWILGGVGGYGYFDLSAIVLGVVGAALILLTGLVDQARAIQRELDEII
jgi:Protein of unknown function (DUF2975)